MLAVRIEQAMPRLRDRIEPALLFAAALLIAFYVFGQTRQPLLFTLSPVIIFAAFRLRLFAAMLIVAAVSAVAVFQTVAGHGIIAALNPNLTERMYLLQLFMAANLFTVLPLRALIGERDRLGVAFCRKRPPVPAYRRGQPGRYHPFRRDGAADVCQRTLDRSHWPRL